MSVSINALIASVPKLDGTNYHEWVFDLKMIAMRARTWKVMCGDKAVPVKEGDIAAWEKNDNDVLTMIGLTVARSELVHIRECKTSNQMWKALADIYARSSRANRIALRQQLNLTTMIDMKVQEYVNTIGDIATRLRAMGVTFRDEDEVDVLIMNLPSTWGGIASSLMIRPGELKVKDVVAVLLEEEVRQKHEDALATSNGFALAARGGGSGKP